MNKYLNIIPLFGLLLASNGCSNTDDDEDLQGDEITEMTAVIADDGSANQLKTYYKQVGSTYVCNWSKGDAYAFTDGTNVASFSNATASAVNSFKLTSYLTGSTLAKVEGAMYYAYYPSKGYSSYADGKYTVSLPSTQAYNDSTIATEVYPMIGKCKRVTGQPLTTYFYNLASIVIVKVKTEGGTGNVESITLQADEPLSGSATASFAEDGTPSLVMASTGSTVTLNCGDGVEVNSNEITPFYMVIPYGTYHNFTVVVNYVGGHSTVISKGTQTFKRSLYRGALATIEAVIPKAEGEGDNGDSAD